jgi:osmoprotectant transport system ATP-binding protein
MIRVEKVTQVYPDGTKAVTDVSFEVAKGELCILLGPSGCGKTTTMKLINRLIPCTSGRIYVDGKDTVQLDENELRRNIGYAIQDVGLFPHMTVAENIGTVPALKGWDKAKQRKRATELLDLLRMNPDDFMDKYPRELSGGQRQRVGVARALGADPPILLMDEPFGALDPITRGELQDEFLRIQDEIRKTIVFVTHDIYEAIKMGESIALMRQGQLVQHGRPADLLFRPKDAFVAGFVGADRGLKGLHLLRAKEVMRKTPPPARVNDTTETARRRMEGEDVSWLAVVDETDRFVGWVGASDLAGGKGVRDVLRASAMVASGDTPLSEALSLMLTSGPELLALAVVDEHNRLQGVLTFKTIQAAIKKAAKRKTHL